MVTAIELDDKASAGYAPRQSDGSHYRFGARVDEADLVDEWDEFTEFLRQCDFAWGVDAETGSLGRGTPDGLQDGRVGVSENHCTPRAAEVYQSAPVGSQKMATFGGGDIKRCAADAVECADGAVYASGNGFPGSCVECGIGAGEGCWHSGRTFWGIGLFCGAQYNPYSLGLQRQSAWGVRLEEVGSRDENSCIGVLCKGG